MGTESLAHGGTNQNYKCEMGIAKELRRFVSGRDGMHAGSQGVGKCDLVDWKSKIIN